jgi:hypothetical protein
MSLVRSIRTIIVAVKLFSYIAILMYLGKIVLQVGCSDKIIQNYPVHYSSLLYLYKSLKKYSSQVLTILYQLLVCLNWLDTSTLKNVD